jgi:RimJ/RimL family protein N-acetyltransferase
VLKQATKLLDESRLGERDRMMLVAWDDELLGIAVLSEQSKRTVGLAFIGIKLDAHGARIDADDGPRLSDSIVESALEEAERLGFDRVTAQVAAEHTASVALLERVGFGRLSRYDRDYDIYALAL